MNSIFITIVNGATIHFGKNPTTLFIKNSFIIVFTNVVVLFCIIFLFLIIVLIICFMFFVHINDSEPQLGHIHHDWGLVLRRIWQLQEDSNFQTCQPQAIPMTAALKGVNDFKIKVGINSWLKLFLINYYYHLGA
uniref:Uncharacterized protein n=1 Tax=Coniferiporia sulphurascens TaxID=175648 RepID=A0A5B9RKL3_CONSH|nr:hypothetical protein PSUO_000055 [Coniferiporia sulphurascens]QEG57197.1 hypothetical protein PSUO_000055 [Coniferiporia sulphurascens]